MGIRDGLEEEAAAGFASNEDGHEAARHVTINSQA